MSVELTDEKFRIDGATPVIHSVPQVIETTPEEGTIVVAKKDYFAAQQFGAAMMNVQQMQQVGFQMREIPVLPSEVPKDTSYLTKVDFPEEGGVLTYMSDHDEPYKGFPLSEMVDRIDLVKKVIRGTLSSLFHSIKKRSKLQLVLIVCVPWLIKDLIRGTLYSFFRVVERFRIKTERYCTAMRELHRAFSVEFHGESHEEKQARQQVRDLICMILEFDNAYRFRFQDIIVELDKQALQKNCSKELLRLFSLMQTRESGQDVRDTWSLFKRFLPVFLFLNKKVKQQIIAVLTELDLSKVELSKEDRHYARPRTDYTFGFMEKENVSN